MEEPSVITPQTSPASTPLTRSRRKSKRHLLALSVGLMLTGAAALALCIIKQPHRAWQFYAQHIVSHQAHHLQPRTLVAAQIVAGAKAQQGTLYNPEYTVISYPNGDVPRQHGACTDVVIRALRAAGYDLQQLIHEDMKGDFAAYPHTWGLSHPDANIDHRRVPNQMLFFKRHGRSLTTTVAPNTLAQWQPGDIVDWDIGRGKLHTGVISDTCNGAGVPFVVHNGYVCVEQDCLTQWKIIGHYRYPAKAGAGGPKVRNRARQMTVT